MIQEVYCTKCGATLSSKDWGRKGIQCKCKDFKLEFRTPKFEFSKQFFINGGGDSSVGLADVEAEVTFSDNIDWEEKDIDDMKDFLREFYDVPITCVKTKEEYDKELEFENSIRNTIDKGIFVVGSALLKVEGKDENIQTNRDKYY